MSISRADARTYVVRIIGGAKSPQAAQMAEEALVRVFTDFQTAKGWEFLLKDTTNGFTAPQCILLGNTIFPGPLTGNALDGINIGIGVSSANGEIPASTTVTAFTRNTDGTIATVTTSASMTTATADVFVAGDIPILAGVNDYNLPPDFYRPYTARLITNRRWPLTWVRPRYWNRRVLDQTIQGIVELYTAFNPVSALSQNKGVTRLRVFRVPAKADTLHLEYYRQFNYLADPIDMPDTYLYQFLDKASAILLDRKMADTNPEAYSVKMAKGLQVAMVADEEQSEDEDVRMISQMETGDAFRPLWSNGEFNPDYGY